MEFLDSKFFVPKSELDMVNNAVVVVDTNLLLSCYQWKEVTINEILNVLKELEKQERLRIPRQVLKEFFNNRPGLILNTLNELNNLKSEINFHKRPLKQAAPIFVKNETFADLFLLESETKAKINEYNKAIEKAKENLIKLFENDHITEEYREIFKKACYKENDIDEEKLRSEFSERVKKKIPPGYKDAGKSENADGDFLIWHSILTLGKEGHDVLFLSYEKKPDWVYCDGNNRVISARRELIEEFYRETNGKSFRFLSPNDFVSLFKPDISLEVKEDLKEGFKSVNIKVPVLNIPKLSIPNYNQMFQETFNGLRNSTEPLKQAMAQVSLSTEPLRNALNEISNLNKAYLTHTSTEINETYDSNLRYCLRCGELIIGENDFEKCTKCGFQDLE